jgi:hypothetical protein
MKGNNIAIIAVTAVIIVIILAYCMFTYGDNDRNDQSNGVSPVELTFSIDDSKLKVVCGDREIKDKDVITFEEDSSLTVTTLDGQRHTIDYAGSWQNDAGMGESSSASVLTNSLSIPIDCVYGGKATGNMSISCD